MGDFFPVGDGAFSSIQCFDRKDMLPEVITEKKVI